MAGSMAARMVACWAVKKVAHSAESRAAMSADLRVA